MNSHSELSNEIPTDKWPLSLLGGWACASYRWKASCAYRQQGRARAALSYSPEPRRTGCAARISPASQVWYSRVWLFLGLYTQGYKMLLRFKLQILSYEENVLQCGYIYASQLKRDRRYVGRSNCHDHRIQIQMFLRKKATGGELHNQTVRVQSASALSVCVRHAEKTLVRLSLQNADLELLSS